MVRQLSIATSFTQETEKYSSNPLSHVTRDYPSMLPFMSKLYHIIGMNLNGTSLD